MEHKPETINLTQGQAYELVRRYVSGGLFVEGGDLTADKIRYTAAIGCLEIRCENDWRTYNGRIRLTITDAIGGNKLTMYFHPDTLERDTETEAAEQQAEIMKSRLAWVMTQGCDHCHQEVIRLWNGELDAW